MMMMMIIMMMMIMMVMVMMMVMILPFGLLMVSFLRRSRYRPEPGVIVA